MAKNGFARNAGKVIFTFLGCIIMLGFTAKAAQVVAIVGEVAITDYDVDQRAKMVAMVQKLGPKNKKAVEEIKKEIINVLIDEQIKRTFAEKAKLEIRQEMVDKFILEYGKRIDKKNMKEIKDMVASYGIDWNFFWNSVVDEIAWSQLVYWGLSANIQFTEGEIAQRAAMQGLNPDDPSVLEAVKREMMEERIALDVQKMISRMKRFKVIEEVE